MSQPLSQHLSHPEPSLAPSEQSDSRLPRPSALTVIIAALALTAILLPLAVAYVGAYARVTRDEYRRQQLVRTARQLEKANARLRLQVDAARAGLRPAEVGQEHDLTVADPSTQVDYVRIPQAPPAVASAPAKARLAAVASWVVALVTFETRVQASTLEASQEPQAGR